MILTYTTRFNAFSKYNDRTGTPFTSNEEGFAVAAAFKAAGKDIADVFTFTNIMAYDCPPSDISKNGWDIDAYSAILKSFDNRYGGPFASSQIMMAIETGQQAAGGIYPGYKRTMCMAQYVKDQGYKGISVWAPNQFTYRYMNSSNQVACNFSGTPDFNETAWNMGYPSNTKDPHNPNCKVYPINETSKQFNPFMADCIENIGPYMSD
mgnify:FL=1